MRQDKKDKNVPVCKFDSCRVQMIWICFIVFNRQSITLGGFWHFQKFLVM